MTATLVHETPAMVDIATRVARVWDAMMLGARSYLEWHGFVGADDAQHLHGDQRRLEIAHQGDLNELTGHVSGVVQAAAREVVARCPGELALFDRNRDELRNISFGRITSEEHHAAIAEQVGPCFVTAHRNEPVNCARLLLPTAGESACATEHEHEDEHGTTLHSSAGIDMERVAQFILGADDIRAAMPFPGNGRMLP